MSGEPPRGERLWGGRFERGPDEEIDRFTRSFPFDHRLVLHDLVGCMAHAQMLIDQGILGASSGENILAGLDGLYRDVVRGALRVEEAATFVAGNSDEDVHTFIERTLIERIGDDGRRLHTARSRNDQTGTALRLFVREEVQKVQHELLLLIAALVERAQEHTDTCLPGYTHLQRGQPVSLAHHLGAHAWSLLEDARRFERAYTLAGKSPLGAGALAGTVHPIDPARSAELLGFESCYPNSMFAVADRDYVVETSFACALLLVHLSRWAEEVILWTSSEFAFARLDDSVAKGSSLMPQKKNPEPAEILRGKSGRAIGDLMAHLVQLKGLPLTYNSDLQEDKEALFDALDTARGSLRAAQALLAGLSFDKETMNQALEGGHVTATDLADLLVENGIPFRSAHEATGAVVQLAESKDCALWKLSEEELGQVLEEALGRAPGALDMARLEPAGSIAAHDSPGGPAPVRVKEQLSQLTQELEQRNSVAAARTEPPILAARRKSWS